MNEEVLAGGWKVGGYYNFCAVSAGSYCYDYDASSSDSTEDICPKGWRLPTGGSEGEYETLGHAIAGEFGHSSLPSSQYNTYRTILHIPQSGYYNYGSAYTQGSYGYFWTSTPRNSSRMYDLDVTGSIYFGYGVERNYGYTIRCILGS